MKKTLLKSLSVAIACILCAGSMSPSHAANSRAPVIKHQPMTVAIQGQSIAMRATVTGDIAVKSVTLCYTTSKDIAPFKLPMQGAGAGLYVATIPANLIARASQVSYYIEALDDNGQTTETQWYVVKVQAPQAGAKPEGTAQEESFWTKPAVIGGGVLLLGGATAAVLANSSKSHNDSSSSSSTPDAADVGTYIGSVTISREISGQTPTYSTQGTTITIAANGAVSSDTLFETQHLQSNLSGSQFTLTATVSETNLTGQIQFVGSVASGRISGSVGGTAHTTSGTNSVYYGTFYAVKQ
jgi:hypothetical protein